MFPYQNSVCTSFFNPTCNTSCSSHSSWSTHWDNDWSGEHSIKLLMTQSCPVLCRPECLYQHPFLKHAQLMLGVNTWAFIYKWLQIINCLSPFYTSLISHPLLWGNLTSTIDGADVWASNQNSKPTRACSERCRYSTTFSTLSYYVPFFLNNQPVALIIQIYSVTKIYMFRASFLPIIRSFLLYIRHW
jgi:hypothetical protein